MDRLEKALAKLTRSEREKIKQILEKLNVRDVTGLDVKKLKGRSDIYRVRKGRIRVLYRADGERIFILAIERRGKDTYKNL